MTAFVVLVVLAALAFAAYKRNAKGADIVVPPAPTRRTDLLYGYYGCAGEQVAETVDHVNLLHESQFEGPVKCVQNILDAKMFTVLDVSPQLFDKGAVRPTAETDLLTFFLQSREALQYVKCIYPIDEPNNTTTAMELTKAIVLIKRVAARLPELTGVKFGVIYASDKPFICQELFDYIGFDDYDKRSSVLSGQYKNLRASLLPLQRTILVPGGAYGQDPTPFINWAETDQCVGIVMPFLWLDDKGGSVGAPGIRSGALRQKYVDAGKSVTGKP